MAAQKLTLTIVSISLILWGCGVEGPTDIPYPHDGEGEGIEPAEDDDGAGQGAGSSGAGAGTSGAGAGSTGAGGAPGTSSSSSTGIGTASSGVTTGGGVGGVCTPDADDNACFVCAKQQCCSEVEACVAEPSCLCWVQCVADTAGDVTLCAGQCGAPGAAILDVLDCASIGCPAECGV